MQPRVVILGAALWLGAAPVGAEHEPPPVQADVAFARDVPTGAPDVARELRDFERLDADRSGGLLLSEVDADSDLGFNFWTHDRDGDGVVSRGEYAEYVLATVDDD